MQNKFQINHKSILRLSSWHILWNNLMNLAWEVLWSIHYSSVISVSVTYNTPGAWVLKTQFKNKLFVFSWSGLVQYHLLYLHK